MLEYKGYKDYSVLVFKEEVFMGRFYSVTNIWVLSLWLRIHPGYWGWSSIRVSHKQRNKVIGDYSRKGPIPAKPRI
jgi:hypothetical protein